VWVDRATGIYIVIKGKTSWPKKSCFCSSRPYQLYGFRALKRNKRAGEKPLNKAAVKDWESEGGNLAPPASSKS